MRATPRSSTATRSAAHQLGRERRVLRPVVGEDNPCTLELMFIERSSLRRAHGLR